MPLAMMKNTETWPSGNYAVGSSGSRVVSSFALKLCGCPS